MSAGRNEGLAAPVACPAWTWRLDRRDGQVVALTSHDRDLVLAGVPYRAAPGMRPSAIEQRTGPEGDTMSVTGAVSAGALTAGDLAAGRWDGARLTVGLADWSEDGAGAAPLVVATGTLGTTRQEGAAFEAELTGDGLNGEGAMGAEWDGDAEGPARVRPPVTSPTCRARLGDAACGVWLAPLMRRATIIAAQGAVVRVAAPDGPAASALALTLAWGRLRVIDGPATGLAEAITHARREADGTLAVTLAQPLGMMDALTPGTPVELTPGCDKRIATCADRFGNVPNFRGEAFLPGNDLLTRYAGG